MPRVLSGWPPPKWPIPLLWSSGAQFKVDGVDIDALHAKAKVTSVDGHRRALQMSEGGCTDTTFFVEGLTLALNEAGAEILNITSLMEEIANNLTVPEDVGSGEAEDFGSGEAVDFGSGEAGNEPSDSYPPQRRKLRAQINNKVDIGTLVKYGIVPLAAKANNMWKEYEVPDPRSAECAVTKAKVDILSSKFFKVHAASETLDEHLTTGLDSIARVEDLNSKLGTTKNALIAIASTVNFIKSHGGPIKFVGEFASPIVTGLKKNVEKAHKKLDPFVKKKIPPVKSRLEDVQTINEDIKTKMETAHEAFHHYAYKVVLSADDRCPQTTKVTVCTDATNRALQAVIDLVDRSAPALPNLDAFNGIVAFINKFSSIIDALSVGELGEYLSKIYQFLTKRRCFCYLPNPFGRCPSVCFSIKDIFDNWVVKFVSGIIGAILVPLGWAVKDLFAKLGLGLTFELPGLDTPAMPTVPSFDFPGIHISCFNKYSSASFVGQRPPPRFLDEKCFNLPGFSLGQLRLWCPQKPQSQTWFSSSEQCSMSAMQSFGWSVSASQGIRCDRDASGIRGSSFWSYPGDGKISIPLPMGFSIFTITYGQSCYAHGSYVLLKLNGAVVSGAAVTWLCAWGTIKSDACFVFPPVAGIPTWTSCLKTVSVSYTPGDVLELIEVNSIAYIRSISLS
eukprot:scaffold22580_cov76-Phaeocystis_antarctica.AAC.1